jgi:5'-nucleotidase
MKQILVVNDDGINSPGLLALAEAVKDLGKVTIVAPRNQKSGYGVALTIRRPLRVEEIKVAGFESFVIDGTPADCVILSLNHLLKEKPQVVLSGYNIGANLSLMAPLSSGTIGAAIEAALSGIPAAAFSFEVTTLQDALKDRPSGINYAGAKKAARLITRYLLEQGLPQEIQLLNVCFPPTVNEQTNLKITSLAANFFKKGVVKKGDPYGMPYYWIKVSRGNSEWEDGTDVYCLYQEDNISVTPLGINLSGLVSKEKIAELKESIAKMDEF